MALDLSALLERAGQLELKESQKINLDCTFVSVLEESLIDVYRILRPRPSDYEKRRQLVHSFNKMAEDIYGSSNGFPIVEAFGSFVMDIFTTGSDLDLSLNFSNDYTSDFPRENMIPIIRKFAKSLRQAKGRFSGVQPIVRARVPVLKVVDRGTGVECDISVENKDGITRSSILSVISSLDERFRILSLLMKVWAKAHHINCSKYHTMNSLTIICLVAFHLQTREPPILPPFSTLFKDGTDSSSIQNAFHRFRSSSGKNEETVSRLFVTLFSKLSSVDSLWMHGLCASTYEGSWISKTWKSGIADMSVEDFLDRSQNCARAVMRKGVPKISKCIQGSVNNLSQFMKGQIEASKLRTLLFGSIPLNIPSDQYIPRENMDLKKLQLPAPVDPIPTKREAPVDPITAKRARYTEATVRLHHNPYETRADNPFLAPQIPFQPSFAHHTGHVPQQPQFPFSPHSGYGPERPQFSVAHYSGYGPRRPQFPVAQHSGYGPQQRQFPVDAHSDYRPPRPQFPVASHSNNGPPRPQFPVASHSDNGPPRPQFPVAAHSDNGPPRPQFPVAHSGYGPQRPQVSVAAHSDNGPPRPQFPVAHSGYGPHRPQVAVAAHSDNGPPRPQFPVAHSGYGPQRPQFPVAAHSDYGPQRPQFPVAHAGYGQQRSQFPSAPNSGYGQQEPQFPFAPKSGYGPGHELGPTHYGWHHNQPGQNQMFR